MQAIQALESMGFTLSLSGSNIHCRYHGQGKAPQADAALQQLRDNKQAAIQFLEQREYDKLCTQMVEQLEICFDSTIPMRERDLMTRGLPDIVRGAQRLYNKLRR